MAAAAEQAALQGGQPPLVVPFVHAGMEEVMPVGRLLPCTGQTVRTSALCVSLLVWVCGCKRGSSIGV